MAFFIRLVNIPYTFSLSVLMMASFVGKLLLNRNCKPLISTSGLKNFLLSILMVEFSCEKVTTTPWVSYPPTSGVSVQAIAIDANDNKWFCTYGDGILQFDGTNWTNTQTIDLIFEPSQIAFNQREKK